jgi:predicted aminopeptidase
LGRRYALWNVYAAPEFSLEAKSWWYPVVGRLKYRGYFSEARARRLAAQLAKKGYDVHVGGVAAYSTLGWFRDPVLNTFIDYDEADLAELIFHELTHQRVFIAGDTEFNEALATTVAEEGARRWLVSRHDRELVRAYQEGSPPPRTIHRPFNARTRAPQNVLCQPRATRRGLRHRFARRLQRRFQSDRQTRNP